MNNFKQKVAIISPKYYPLEDGLGHHTKYLSEYLSHNLQIDVYTTDGLKALGHEKNFVTIKSWSTVGIISLILKLKKNVPDAIVIQYLPFLFRRRSGISFPFVLLLFLLRIVIRRPIFTICHELNYPFENSFKSLIMYCFHHLMLYSVLIFSKKIFGSTRYYTQRMKFLYPMKRKNIFWLPSGCNFNFSQNVKRESTDVKRETLILGGMGGLHPDKNIPKIFEIVSKIPGITYRHIGISQEVIDAAIPLHLKNALAGRVFGTGFISDDQIEIELSRLDYLLTIYKDGITSRRGTIMAALKSGTEVISTFNDESDDLFVGVSGIHLFESVEDLEKALHQMPSVCGRNNDLVNFFQEFFSWEVIAKRFITYSLGGKI